MSNVAPKVSVESRLGQLAWRYGLAVLLISAAFAVKLALPQYLGPPFILAYPALFLVALVSGSGPGLLATGIGVIITATFLMEPIGSIRVSNVRDIISLLVFAVVGVGLSLLAGRYRRARRDLARNLTAQRALLAALPAAVYITRELDGRTIETNPFGVALMTVPENANVAGSAPKGQRSRTFRAMKDGREIPPGQLPVQIAAAIGVDVRDFEFDLVSEDGFTRNLLGNATPLRDEEGVTFGAVGAFIDITTRRTAENRLRETLATNQQLVGDLQRHIGEVKRLTGLLPICMHCKRIRGDRGFWERVEQYVSERSDAVFSHGLCPECAQKHYPDPNQGA
jgi:PAS domain-containing protein